MLDLNFAQSASLSYNGASDAHEDDARLDRAVNALLMVMALENADVFEGVAEVTPGFDELENELASLQANELRAAYERVRQAEVALDAAFAVADAEAQAELEVARREVEALEREFHRLRDETKAMENKFEPYYQQLAQEMEAEKQCAAQLRHKAAGLNPEARSQFEHKVELVLKARLQPFEERYLALEAERTACRLPLEQQIAALEYQKRGREEDLEQVVKGQSETQKRVTAMREGSAGESATLYAAVRELMAARENFGRDVARVENGLAENERMSRIAKRYPGYVEQARLELDAPINAAGALARAKDGQIADAKRMLRLALRGGLGESNANEIWKEIAHAEYTELVKAWEQDLLQRAPQLHGMSTFNRYKERIASKSHEAGYQALSRDLTRVLAQAERLAGQGVAARRRTLEVHAAQYINSQNKFFSAQVMPDSGRVMIAVRKNGQWLRHALCTMVVSEGSYEIKTTYYEHKTAFEDQVEWDKRRARFERRLQLPLSGQGESET